MVTDDDVGADVIDRHPSEPTEQLGATGVLVSQASCLRLRDDAAPRVRVVREVGLGPHTGEGFDPPAALALWRVWGKPVRQREATKSPL